MSPATEVRLIRAARSVVNLMDKPIVGTSKEAARAWRAATRLVKALDQYDEERRG